ncbi:MAG: FeoA family protein [Oceanidesulfovibrio sp.]
MNRSQHRHGKKRQARIESNPLMGDECPACKDFLPLSAVGKGCRCRIRRHRGCGAVRQRLMDMGFVPNAEVEVIRVATLGDPIEIRVGDSFVTLRKREAEQIETTAA